MWRICDEVQIVSSSPKGSHSATTPHGAPDAAGLERACEQPLDLDSLLDDHIRVREGAVRVAHLGLERGGQVVWPLLVYERRAGVERGLGIADRGKLLPVDLDELGAVLGGVGSVGEHDRHRLPHVAHPPFGEEVIRRLALAGEVVSARLRADLVRHVRRGEDQVDTGAGFRRGRVDAQDPRVGQGASHERGVEHPRPRDVRDVPSAAHQELSILASLQRLADPVRYWSVL
jgi:hypothetical protein